MRPLELKLKNFGPFIDETIDFSCLNEASLFLISGKTGTGKTTIFDGMTYALFGETSGRVRSGKEMRSSFASPEEETAVEFTFEHQGLLYKVLRKPEQSLKKKRGKGDRTQTAKAELTICQPDGKELRQYSKKTEVNEQINELLHLDVKQFSQIVLLPQGDFRTFLNANSQDKEGVLRNLFGTEIYQRFGDKLKEQLKAANKNLDTSNTQLDMLKEQFVWEETPVEMLAYPDFIQQSQQQITHETTALAQEKQQLELLETEQGAAEKKYYQAKELTGFFDQKVILEKKQQELVNQQATIQEERAQLRSLEWGERQRSLLDKKDELTSDNQLLAAKEKEIQQATQENQAAFEDYQKRQSAFDTQLPVFETQQERLQELKQQIPLLKELQANQLEKLRLEKEITRSQEQQEKISQQLTELLHQLSEYQLQVQQAAELQKNQTFINQCSTMLKDVGKQDKLVQDQSKKITAKQAELQHLANDIKQNLQQIEDKTHQHQQLQQDSIQMQIAHLSAMLRPGEPCPICGSIEHPAVHDSNKNYQLEEILATEQQAQKVESVLTDLRAKQAQLETKKSLTEQQQAEINQLLVEYQEAKQQEFKNLQEFTQAERQKKFSSLSDYQSYINQEQTAVNQGLTAIETANQQIEILNKEQGKLQEQGSQIEQHLKELKEAESQVEGAISSLVKQGVQGETEALEKEQTVIIQWIQNYETNRQSLTAEGQSLKQQEARLNEQQLQNIAEQKKNQENLKQQQEKLSQALSDRDPLMTVEDLRRLLTETYRIEELRQLITDYETQVKINQEQLKDILNKTQGKTLPELAGYEEALEQAREAVKIFQEEYFQKRNRLEKNQRTLADFSKLYQKNQQQLDALKQLSELTKTINGDNPKKMSLERYVLRTYLSEVLHVANQRLSRLTRNRYQFELSTETGSYRNQTGLEINVYDDDAGASRSAHTLSGGESFIAALALALSLAEVIQSQAGGITIEALFIDEGFGSLDEDSLNMAMEALETIESEGRMIGIISHVRELKERVPQQILVTGTGSGQSRIDYQF